MNLTFITLYNESEVCIVLSFKKWLSKQVVIGSDVTYNTANDIIADNNFPESVCKFVMLDYLEKNADDNTIVAFDDFYRDYIKYITQNTYPVD